MSLRAARLGRAHAAIPRQRRASASPLWPSVVMAAYGAGWAATIPLVGQLYVAELIALACLPFVGWQRTLQSYRSLRIILAGYLAFLLGLIVSDLVNATAPNDFLRGWANLVVAITSTLFVTSVLRRNIDAIVWFLIGSSVAMLIFGSATYGFRDGEVDLSWALVVENTNMFKVRFVPFLMPALMLSAIFLYWLRPTYSAALYATAALLFLALDARSAGLALLIAATLIALRVYGIRVSTKAALLAGPPLLLIGYLAFVGYVDYTLKHNPEGQNARQLAKLENPYNPLALLLQGRSDWAITADAIAAKPVFGHGSWAYDVDGYYGFLRAERSNGLQEYLRSNQRIEGQPLIPVHSALGTSWLWAGLLGLSGFLLVFREAIRLGLSALAVPGPYAAVATLMFVMLLWDALFSPIGVIRLSFPQTLGLLIVLQGHAAMRRRGLRSPFGRQQ